MTDTIRDSQDEAEIEYVLELLDNLKESVERYYDWAELLQREFREMKARVSVLEARDLERRGNDRCEEFGKGEGCDDMDLTLRLERLRDDDKQAGG